MFFDRLVQRIVVHDQSGPESIVGVTDAELEQIRQDQDVEKLPAYYSRFLLRMGRRAGQLLLGTDAFYPSILGSKAGAKELLDAEGVGSLLSDNAFVFAMHQGYLVYWFSSIEESNPAVFSYKEGDTGIGSEWPTFTDFLALSEIRW